jgi:hypothetical protein
MVVPPIEIRPADKEVTAPSRPRGWGKTLKWLFPVAALLFVALIAVPGFLQKWLWMRQLDYAGIFWTLFSVKVGLTCRGVRHCVSVPVAESVAGFQKRHGPGRLRRRRRQAVPPEIRPLKPG